KQMDSYSAFYEADGKTPTGLTGYLKDRGLTQVYLVGLATDFCVAWSAMDARKAGFGALVIEDACRGIDADGSLAKAWKDMLGAGVKRIKSTDLAVCGQAGRLRLLGDRAGDEERRRRRDAADEHRLHGRAHRPGAGELAANPAEDGQRGAGDGDRPRKRRVRARKHHVRA